MLTWWQGNISLHGFGLGEDVVADDTYTDIAHVRAGNGHESDLHEFQLTPQGTALITAYDPILCNLSSVGGPSYGGLTNSVFQEIDVKTGLVMYEWTSLDHVALEESYETIDRSSIPYPYDFFHLNSISVDRDGSLLISSRNTWTVYKLNPQSGQIVWRLGGKHSSFKMGPATGIAWQHDPRELPDGAISIFDNGSSPKVHDQSRAVVVSLSGQGGPVTLVTRLEHAPLLLAESQGSVQALANGDWFVGWGQEPFFSEFDPEGKLAVRRALPRARRVLPRVPLRVDGNTGAPADVRVRSERRERRRGRLGAERDRVRELERRHAGGRVAAAGGRERVEPGDRRAGSARRLRDGDPAAGGGHRAVLGGAGAGRAGAVAGHFRGGRAVVAGVAPRTARAHPVTSEELAIVRSRVSRGVRARLAPTLPGSRGSRGSRAP